MTTVENPAPVAGLKPSRTERRINELEEKLDYMVWLHAELMYALKVLAAQQQMAAQQVAANIGAAQPDSPRVAIDPAMKQIGRAFGSAILRAVTEEARKQKQQQEQQES